VAPLPIETELKALPGILTRWFWAKEGPMHGAA